MAVNKFYFFGSYNAFRPFIIKVNSGADGTFTIPTSGGGYNYNVKTSDGQNFTGVTGNLTITFPTTNTDYVIEISGAMGHMRFGFMTATERDKIVELIQFGDVTWTNYAAGFSNCKKMLSTSAGTIVTSTMTSTNMQSFFDNAELFNSKIDDADYSIITNMNFFLRSAKTFNRNMPTYLPNVTSFQSAMEDVSNFDKPINITFDKKVYLGSWIGATKTTDVELTLNDGCTYISMEVTLTPSPISRLIINGLDKSLDIRYMSATLVGVAIDNLADSVKDLTGDVSQVITMRISQFASGINTAKWTAKNWTITQVP